MAPPCRFSSLLVLLLLPAVRSSFPRGGVISSGGSSADCGPGKASTAGCPVCLQDVYISKGSGYFLDPRQEEFRRSSGGVQEDVRTSVRSDNDRHIGPRRGGGQMFVEAPESRRVRQPEESQTLLLEIIQETSTTIVFTKVRERH
ncbi:hypothetical protein F2P81_019715 [Scophthalmus maximus]|uniref:Uncharacterized protein n=1 Tax=Scophthalmus maximus TaxID=52904 RepID=A0A6A4S8T1_SCOMX|nr:hypothetical protein F2P81_019715 [Scophthalmus maximus]